MIRSLASTIGAATMLATITAGLGTAAHASEPAVGGVLGTTVQEIVSVLAEQGYTVNEVERENGRIEAKVSRDGQRLEIKVDAESGRVVRIEAED